MADGKSPQEPEVIETEGVDVTDESVNDNGEGQVAEVIDMGAHREQKESAERAEKLEEEKREMEEAKAQVGMAVAIAEKSLDTASKVMVVLEKVPVAGKIIDTAELVFDKGVGLLDNAFDYGRVAWNRYVPNAIKNATDYGLKASTYVPPTVPDIFSASACSLIRAGLVEVPGVDPADIANNEVAALNLLSKYEKDIAPESDIAGFVAKLASYIEIKKEELFYSKFRASLAKHRALKSQEVEHPTVETQNVPNFPAANNDTESAAA